jgi:4-diphosphocytidyl-2-C-methyl-D-erythritol kinase
MRSCTVRSLAKVNLDLRVFNKRPDGYHELRTVFQTISLYDNIRIEFEPGRNTRIDLDGNVDIPNNLIVRAAQAICEHSRLRGVVRFGLTKRIPMGAGLGGGSSNAAAVLLALPVLAGVRLEMAVLSKIGAELGSDVPFFLFGGTALGLGRGTELYPLPDVKSEPGLLVAPGVHVSTAEAYGALNRSLTTAGYEPDTSEFQSLVWGLGEDCPASSWAELCANDFEGAVFSRYPRLKSIRNQLRRAGAKPAMMTGSGSALFGLFETKDQAAAAVAEWERRSGAKELQINLMSLVSRRQYQALWRGQLRGHLSGTVWPPQSRY